MTVHNDTVEKAQATPDEQQPYAELGLKDDEYQRIHDVLGRRPTDAELTMYSVMWSEHLSLIHISEPTRQCCTSRMPSSA